MGCVWFKAWFPFFGNKRSPLEESPVKTYSWDKKEVLNKGDYIIEDLSNQRICKDNINGEQFIIQNCKDCSILLLDHSASVTVDDCINCFIFLAPIRTSFFIRDSSDCTVVLACQQFRSRDCKRLQLHLCCTSQPSIEASCSLSFQCYQSYYPLISEHFTKSGLNEYNNNWSSIHDFTPPSDNHLNFDILPPNSTYDAHIQCLATNHGISASADSSYVPFTHSPRSLNTKEGCLVVFSKVASHKIIINTFLKIAKQEGCVLVRTKEVECCKVVVDGIFNQQPPNNLPTNGSLICLEMCGERASVKCRQAVDVANRVVGKGGGIVDGDGRIVGGDGGIVGDGVKELKIGGGFGGKYGEGLGFMYVSGEDDSGVILSNFHILIKSQMAF